MNTIAKIFIWGARIFIVVPLVVFLPTFFGIDSFYLFYDILDRFFTFYSLLQFINFLVRLGMIWSLLSAVFLILYRFSPQRNQRLHIVSLLLHTLLLFIVFFLIWAVANFLFITNFSL